MSGKSHVGALAVLFLASTLGSAKAQIAEFEDVSAWKTYTVTQKLASGLKGCIANQTEPASSPSFWIQQTTDGRIGFAFSGGNWNIGPNHLTSGSVTFENGFKYPFYMRQNPPMLEIFVNDVANSASMKSAIAKSKFVKVYLEWAGIFGNINKKFSLAGSADALRSLDRCIAQIAVDEETRAAEAEQAREALRKKAAEWKAAEEAQKAAEEEKNTSEGNSTPQTQPAAPLPALYSAGSGFVVGGDGSIITNAHVVAECNQLQVVDASGQKFKANLRGVDPSNDLALLQSGAVPRAVAELRLSPSLRPGDKVAVYGYPLPGTLSDTGNIVSGTLSSLLGIQNDVRFVQFSAPIQPGNSGGALLDSAGNAVGIATMKLDELAMSQEVGVFPQNVNFAVRISIVASFLDAFGVQYKAASSIEERPLPDVADLARAFSMQVLCYR
jgi:S1-C subfamily serine protease